MRRVGLALALCVAVGACGEDTTRPTLNKSTKLVDRSKTPYVNALEVAPDGSFLLTTNRGFWHVAQDGSKAEPITNAVVRASEGTSRVGKFLEIADVGGDELLGSGHPDDKDKLPPFLGFMRSGDGGRTWTVVSRLGSADLHIIRRVGTTLYAWDAVLGAVLVSNDGGRRWLERFTPQELVLDMVVDPDDPKYLLISTEQQIYRSQDQGKAWRPFGRVQRARLAWRGTGELYRALKDGTWERSEDRGATWDKVGELPGEPWKIKAVDARVFHVALADGSIASTDDGGESWDLTFRAS